MQQIKSDGHLILQERNPCIGSFFFWDASVLHKPFASCAFCLSGKLNIMDMQIGMVLSIEDSVIQKIQLACLSFGQSVSNFLQMFGTI